MAFQMPSFISRLVRPFSTSVSRPLQPDSLASKPFAVPTERAIVAAGCFWGVEHIFRENFKTDEVLDCRVGYTGGHTENPKYREVCSTKTGHAEALLLVFDPEKVTYARLIEFFFRIHNPTQFNRQGNDVGSQYRSAVFTTSDEQKGTAEEVKKKVGEQWYPGQSIATEIVPATQWYDAEDYHQKYLIKEPNGYQCDMHNLRSGLPDLKWE